MVSNGIAHATPQDVIFRDPSSFVAGELSRHQSYWKFILSQNPKKYEILSYIVRGVNISNFFVPFKGDFQGNFIILLLSQRLVFLIANLVLISRSLLVPLSLTELKTAHSWFGEKVGSVQPTHLFLPITVEPTKPRMCHDERFFELMD